MSSHGSKYEKYKLSAIYPHKHCIICNKMISEDDNEFGEYCSMECANIPKEKKKKKWRQRIFLIVGYFVFFGIIIGVTYLLNRR